MSFKRPPLPKIGRKVRKPNKSLRKLNRSAKKPSKVSKFTPKWRTTSIGRGVKKPNSPNMKGLDSNQKSRLRNKIKAQKDFQRRKINEIRMDLKKIENTTISFSGLNQLSKKSIKRLHDRRKITIIQLIKNTNNLMITSRIISKLEKQFLS